MVAPEIGHHDLSLLRLILRRMRQRAFVILTTPNRTRRCSRRRADVAEIAGRRITSVAKCDRADVTFLAPQRFGAHHDRDRIEAFNRLAPRMTVISDQLFRRFKFLRCKIAFHFSQILIPVSRYQKLLFGTRCRRYGFAILIAAICFNSSAGRDIAILPSRQTVDTWNLGSDFRNSSTFGFESGTGHKRAGYPDDLLNRGDPMSRKCRPS
jgi:hypothetical protein